MEIERKAQSANEVKQYILETLRRELVGPSPGYPAVQINGEEILRPQDPPRYRYACGILFPQGVTYSGSLKTQDEEEGIQNAEAIAADESSVGEAEASGELGTDSDAETDGEMNTTSMFLPSTIGISFLAEISGGLLLKASWANYELRSVKGYPDSSEEAELWFRVPFSEKLSLSASQLEKLQSRSTISSKESHGKLDLHVVSRPWGNKRLITVTLINSTGADLPINEACFFQCELEVFAEKSSRILPYPGRPISSQSKEEQSLSLLYRHRPVFAVGHGCAADWSDQVEGTVTSVRSEALPTLEQKPILPREDISGVDLSMKQLAESSKDELVNICNALADSYEMWITDRNAELQSDSSISSELRDAGSVNIDECKSCLGRIRDGIEILGNHKNALEAFRLMNLAMLQQRDHYALSINLRPWIEGAENEPVTAETYSTPQYTNKTKWRPFQLAFILMNVCAFADPKHVTRSIVDVIWFPTGGGKTEAYLGLAAFAILLRRLEAPENAGTTVLMRYTLRLLTTQQFQRASSLICALENIRRADSAKFGAVPISIGLWLGGAVTPNKHAQAVTEFARISRDGGGNPFIVQSCPWCGSVMGPQSYGRGTRIFGYRKIKGTNGQDRIQFRCEDKSCEFSGEEGLPLEVVDEGIYDRPPTLIVGTVDKFAMMPWEPRSRVLFGIDNTEALQPPSLIIQDELHLISGPLGSMVGHYETVIDEFSTDTVHGIPAKIVASTATIARAKEQIEAVYGRTSMLFPPQGLKAGESYFAYEDSSGLGRTYIGVLATALPSHVTAQVRCLSALLQSVALVDAPDSAKDPYWTLMVYFNSLRELGRASTLVQADIREYLNSVWDRIGLTENLMPGKAKQYRRFINNFDELTSRMRSADIPATLQKLFTSLPSRDAIDLCYATNMIQVGLDVSRLSLMSIVGQPKGASEYIQASSRVGRDAGKPGLVLTNYNPFKPRDRSHFEGFRGFHENAYRHVEPTSVTPFSIPVCERAIHALAVSLARFKFPELRDQPSRGVAGRRQEIADVIIKRIAKISPEEVGRATTILNRFLDDWERRKPQFYGDIGGGSPDPLIWPAGKPIRSDIVHLAGQIRSTPSSMRNVDAECEAVPAASFALGDDEQANGQKL